MKNQATELTILSEEELLQRKRTLRGVTIGSFISMVLLIGFLAYLAITKNQYTLLAVACCLPLTILPSIIALSKVKKEIGRRAEHA